MHKEINISSEKLTVIGRLKSYAELMKLRLSSLVVLSAILGYLLGPGAIIPFQVLLLCLGGFLITGASNAFNQIWERDLDKLMIRTQNRPLPLGKITVFESALVGVLLGITGVFILWLINDTCAVLGILALVLYVAVYTPLKTITPLAVFVGAIPGSIPPMLGFIAASGNFGLEAGVLFMIQFFWQFPHFWAIAWKLDDDYKKAGFRLLPSGNRDKRSAYQIMLYTLFLIPVAMLPWVIELCGITSMLLAVALSIVMLIPAIGLFKRMELKQASRLMFFSFFYLPLLLFIFFLDKL
jgi:protoheme IX farnesyltransferase